MHETELKFLIPTDKFDTLKKRVAVKSSKTHQLDAYYFDTAEQILGKNGIAVRIRNENGTWVQTLKAKGDGIAKRIEDNVELTIADNCDRDALVLDFQLFSKSTLKLVNAVMPINELTEQLTIKFSSHINRITREIKATNSTGSAETVPETIEVALDTGHIQSGELSTPVCEIEFELLSGSIDFLIATASSWVKRYQLHYSTLTKAGAGARLYDARNTPNQRNANTSSKTCNKPPAKALKSVVMATDHKLKLKPETGKAEFLKVAIQNCLLHILPNVTELTSIHASDIDDEIFDSHVHQTRVGIRRLRTLLADAEQFDNSINSTAEDNSITNSITASETNVDSISITNWNQIIKKVFSTLGEYRDREIIISKTQPFIETVGSPTISWQAPDKQSVITALRHKDFQVTLLDLIRFASSTVANSDKPTKSNKKLKAEAPTELQLTFSKILNKKFKKIAKNSEKFGKLDHEAQHEVRKQLKKLRYLCEFAMPVFANNKKQAKQFLKYLKPAQEVLGEFNDASVGMQSYQHISKEHPEAWFAVGYFKAIEKQATLECAEILKTVKFAPKFW